MVKGENPQLQIKISRSDTEKDIVFADKSNITVTDSTVLPKLYSNFTSRQAAESWTNATFEKCSLKQITNISENVGKIISSCTKIKLLFNNDTTM